MSAECPRNLFTGRSGRDTLPTQDTSEAGRKSGDLRPVPSTDLSSSEMGVREPSTAPGSNRDYQKRSQRLAHPSNYLAAQLNAAWRVLDSPLQWRLQRKKGNLRSKNSGWRDRSFCTTREGLLRCVREYCGEVEPAARVKLIALPEHHAIPNLDVLGIDQAHIDSQSKPLAPKALEYSGAVEQPPCSSEPALS